MTPRRASALRSVAWALIVPVFIIGSWFAIVALVVGAIR